MTRQIGNDLNDSRNSSKLGSNFETKILKVAFGCKNAPQTSSPSNNKKIWLAVGITLAILLPLLILIFWKCYPRNRRVRPNHFAMDNVDDEGFDGQERAHILLSQKASTFKDAREQEKPLKKTENEKVSLVRKDSNKQGPSHQGEDTDDR
ncbi:Hypothetical predicted protein [Paramuricea clavata]|uniref:Uncharacterized protein n=1 Tax=Paramuricea clavata TaxID=317549 RepID=A0A6S7JV39_PARCT|nr:Hypothetical predicted protein [Paramuricea clavata]